MTAFTAGSGGFPVATSQRRVRHRERNASSPSAWLTAGAMLATGCGLILVSVLLAVIFILVAHLNTASPGVRSLLVASVTALFVTGLVMLVVSWAVQIVGRRQRHTYGQLAEQLDELRTELAGGAAGQQQRQQDLAALPHRVAELVEQRWNDRLAEIERRMNAVEMVVRDAARAQAIIARAEGAEVVPLHSAEGYRGGR